MSGTHLSGFDRLVDRLGDGIKSAWFLPIRTKNKRPDAPKGVVLKGNETYRLRHYQVRKRLKSGQNYGIYGMPGGLMFLDLDVLDGDIVADEILDIIPDTFSVRTRNGGMQYYFWNSGEYGNQELIIDGVHAGELRTNWQYVVGVGSFVYPDDNAVPGSDGSYRMVHDRPIQNFTGEIETYFQKGIVEKAAPSIKKIASKGKSVLKDEHFLRIEESGRRVEKLNSSGIQSLLAELRNRRK